MTEEEQVNLFIWTALGICFYLYLVWLQALLIGCQYITSCF
jgi:hypothetical protein